MNRYIPDKYRSYFFLIIFASTVIVLLAVYNIGARQDKAYRANYNLYQQALKLMGEEKYPQAQESLAMLDADSQASCQVLYMQAVCAEKSGDLASAAELMEKASETRPAYLMNQDYLYDYGLILYELDDYEIAQLYFQQSLKYPQNTELVLQARNYLTEIANKSMGGRKG